MDFVGDSGRDLSVAAWLLISYATQHTHATRLSISLLGQAVLVSVLASWFLNEEVSVQLILGGIILLFGIRLIFMKNP